MSDGIDIGHGVRISFVDSVPYMRPSWLHSRRQVGASMNAILRALFAGAFWAADTIAAVRRWRL